MVHAMPAEGWLKSLKNGIDNGYHKVQVLTDKIPGGIGKFVYAFIESAVVLAAYNFLSRPYLIAAAIAYVGYQILTAPKLDFKPVVNAMGFQLLANSAWQFATAVSGHTFSPILRGVATLIGSLFAFSVTKVLPRSERQIADTESACISSSEPPTATASSPAPTTDKQ